MTAARTSDCLVAWREVAHHEMQPDFALERPWLRNDLMRTRETPPGDAWM
jgi:hypothetical protein